MKDYPNRMTAEEARVFGEDVLNIVAQIPRGQVTTYGYIAALAGWPSHSRMVGRKARDDKVGRKARDDKGRRKGRDDSRGGIIKRNLSALHSGLSFFDMTSLHHVWIANLSPEDF